MNSSSTAAFTSISQDPLSSNSPTNELEKEDKDTEVRREGEIGIEKGGGVKKEERVKRDR